MGEFSREVGGVSIFEFFGYGDVMLLFVVVSAVGRSSIQDGHVDEIFVLWSLQRGVRGATGDSHGFRGGVACSYSANRQKALSTGVGVASSSAVVERGEFLRKSRRRERKVHCRVDQ